MTRNLAELIQKSGGSDEILRILKLFYAQMAQDTMIGFFFTGKDLDSIAEHQHSFLLKASGLSKTYSGRTPSHAHLNLPPILPGHFDRRLKILEEVLQSQSLPPELIQTWIDFENAFRNVVVSTA